jgi:transposase InsO family protein
VVHVAVDDHSRLAYAEELPHEAPATTAAFTERALGFFASCGIAVRRILTDNGTPYRSGAFAACLAEHGITHKRTRPYTPRTNGKAEAMVGLLLRGWAYRRPYRTTAHRVAALPACLPHGVQLPPSARRA